MSMDVFLRAFTFCDEGNEKVNFLLTYSCQ